MRITVPENAAIMITSEDGEIVIEIDEAVDSGPVQEDPEEYVRDEMLRVMEQLKQKQPWTPPLRPIGVPMFPAPGPTWGDPNTHKAT